MHSSHQDVVTEQVLREQLLSVNTSNNARDQNEMQTSSPASPNDPNSLEHTMSGSGMMSASAGSDDGNDNDGRKGYGKRELSTSKRAAQNRAAQRAFRQRKEGYIKKLEEQVRDYNILNDNYKTIQAENYQLRDYIINLQSRLIESQGDFPQPPPNIDGLHPGGASSVQQQQQQQQQPPPQPHLSGPGGPTSISGLEQMRAAAAHMAGRGDPIRHSPTEATGYHHLSDTRDNSVLLTRIKADEREMTAAQQALQGRAER